MRLWSLHPFYLDAQGLGGLWRELCIAFSALTGKRKGYYNHPQLDRFKNTAYPVEYLSTYSRFVWKEADRRGYKYNEQLIPYKDSDLFLKIPVNTGQVEFERNHLLKKLEIRAPELTKALSGPKNIKVNPIFYEIEGEIENWERV